MLPPAGQSWPRWVESSIVWLEGEKVLKIKDVRLSDLCTKLLPLDDLRRSVSPHWLEFG